MATLSSLLGSSFQGNSGVIAIANTVVVTPDTNPSVADLTTSNTGLLTAQFSLPRAPDISVGTTTVTNPNANPSLSNSGTNGDAVLDFTLPRAANVSLGSVSTVNPDASPSITNSGTNGDVTLDINIPRAANVTISSVSVGSNTTNAAVTNSGANGDVALNFTIPKGGDVALGTVSVVNPNVNPSISDVGTNGDSVFNFGLPRAANVSIGTVSTGAAGSSAAVTNSGSNGDVVLNFTIPRGDTGTGDVTGPASATDNAIVRFDGTTGKLVQNSSVTIDDSGNIGLQGNLLLTGSATTTDQARTIDFTGFDKEGTTDFTDRAYISHTTNVGGHTGSVLVISSQNDTSDGVAFLTNASSYLKRNGNTIWDAGNDGSGSGLDADLLDGNQASAFKTNSATDSNQVYIRNSSPTIYFRDLEHNSGMIHVNSNLMYILRGGVDTTTWTQVNGQWPWIFNLSNNDAIGGGNLTLQGGNITLNGTGRIQGIDTVTDGTDAANKTYVDNAVASGVTTGKAIAMAIVFG